MLTSYSGRMLLNSCPRKFQLRKVYGIGDREDTEENPNFAFGLAVEAGVVEFTKSKSLARAAVACFAGWDIDLFAERKDKSIWNALVLMDIIAQQPEFQDSDFEVAILEGKPAIQVGYSIDCGDGYFERGYIDLILYSKSAQLYTVVEIKTTGANVVHPESYQNSAQGTGYVVVLDAILRKLGLAAGQNFNVLYIVAQVPYFNVHLFPFPKGARHKLEWLLTLLLDKKKLQSFEEEDFYPKHGQSCVAFNRACSYFGECHTSLAGFPKAKQEIVLGDYDYNFTLEDL